jgi:hypothetical protein
VWASKYTATGLLGESAGCFANCSPLVCVHDNKKDSEKVEEKTCGVNCEQKRYNARYNARRGKQNKNGNNEIRMEEMAVIKDSRVNSSMK